MLPKPPTSVTIGASKTSLTVRIAEAELKTAVDGVHGSVKADKEGAEAEVKKGDVKAGVSGKWDGSSFGVKTEVGRREVRRQGRAQGRQLEVVGRARVPARGRRGRRAARRGRRRVERAHRAHRLARPAARRRLAVGDVAGRMGQIKPAIDAIGKVAERSGKSGATLRVTASGEDGGFTAGVSLVIVF